jgi:uncharacterized membrane protein
MKRIFTYFLQGLVLVAPLIITAYTIYLIFDFTDGLLRDYITDWFGKNIPGLGVIFVFVFLTILGLIGESMVARPFRVLTNRLLTKAPLLKVIYSSLTDLFSAFVGKEKKFSKPVMVCINRENNLWKMGFITQESLNDIGVEGMLAVYFPHAYNFSGELFFVDSSAIKPLDMNPAEAMKFMVSGGVTRFN